MYYELLTHIYGLSVITGYVQEELCGFCFD